MILFFVRGEVDSDRFISFCYDNYKNVMTTNENKYPEKCNIIREDGKKPKLDVEGVYFNLSHSHGVCVVAMSNTEIGVDIEKIRDIDYNKFKFIEANSKEEFFEKWTERESYLKYTGEGIKNIKLDIPKSAHFEHFPVFNDYHACVCAIEQNISAYEIDINAI